MKRKTKYTPHNYTKSSRTKKNINYIVIHFTSGDGDTAKNNVIYFFNGYRGASAHDFVDHLGTIWSSVKEKDTAWHCGAKVYKSGCSARNSNSIGIEICSNYEDGFYYFKEKALEDAAALAACYMIKYNIPISNVVRHYDVTGKVCPAPMIGSKKNPHHGMTGEALWKKFKEMILDHYNNDTIVLNGKSYSKKATCSVKYQVTTKSGINLRKTAPSGTVLTAIPKGAVIDVVSTQMVGKNTWGKTTYDGKTGWCCLSKYTKEV